MYLIFTDEEGVSQKLKVPNRLCVVLNYDDKFQPIGKAYGLLDRVFGPLASNHILLFISFEIWSMLTFFGKCIE